METALNPPPTSAACTFDTAVARPIAVQRSAMRPRMPRTVTTSEWRLAVSAKAARAAELTAAVMTGLRIPTSVRKVNPTRTNTPASAVTPIQT